jgi:pimeloyl-ACP methyl ester carboxylesterase
MPTISAPLRQHRARTLLIASTVALFGCGNTALAQDARQVDLHATAPDGIVLAGTLHLPAGDGPFATVILVHGSEPGERTHRGYQGWAAAIVAAGFGCLVVDKRGVGESGGEYVEAPDIDIAAADFQAWVEVVKQQAAVRADAIGLLGWSQAGWVAPGAASRSPDVAFLVLISGPGVSPLEQNIYDKGNRAAAGAPTAADATLARTAVRKALTYMVTGVDKAGAEAAWQAVAEAAWFQEGYTGIPLYDHESLLSDPRGQTFIVHNGYDPEPALRALTIPVLALFGSADRIVPVERSLAVMRREISPPARFESRMIENGDHGLGVPDGTGRRPLDPTVRPMIFEWLRGVVGSSE